MIAPRRRALPLARSRALPWRPAGDPASTPDAPQTAPPTAADLAATTQGPPQAITGPSTEGERLFLVHAVKDCATYFPADVTYADVQRALDGVSAWGAWVGPVRVTRMANSCKLHVARLWRFDDSIRYVLPTHVETLRERTDTALEGLTQVNAWTTVASPFAENLNGPRSYWEGGNASRTSTRDQYPEGAARLDPEENPTGPTNGDTHPRPPLDATGAITQSQSGGGTALAVVGVAALAVGGLWLASRGRNDHEVRIRLDRSARSGR